ncbi:type II secretory pathway component PulJ [Rhodococcus sp. UYP5]
MVIFFELLLALAAVAIIAFSLYVVYRLVTEES